MRVKERREDGKEKAQENEDKSWHFIPISATSDPYTGPEIPATFTASQRFKVKTKTTGSSPGLTNNNNGKGIMNFTAR